MDNLRMKYKFKPIFQLYNNFFFNRTSTFKSNIEHLSAGRKAIYKYYVLHKPNLVIYNKIRS